MICILQIVCIIYGIIALVKGRFSLPGGKIVVGIPARIIGVIFVTWIPMSLIVG